MSALVHRISKWIRMRSIAGCEIACLDGIRLAHLRWRDDSEDLFRRTIEDSLRLVRDHDPRRYSRIKRHIRWIVNAAWNMSGAEYDPDTQSCIIKYEDMPYSGHDLAVAFYASSLVHLATHGVIFSRGIRMTPEHRSDIMRLCVAEQNRFCARLTRIDSGRYPSDLLQFEFNEQDLPWEWTATQRDWRKAIFSHWVSDMKAEPDGACAEINPGQGNRGDTP